MRLDCIVVLKQYNRWRQGEDDSIEMPHPPAITVAIEQAIDAVEKLRMLDDAVRNLLKQKGRHNIEVAYKQVAALVGEKL